MALNNEDETSLDHLCNGAISILEMLGNYNPSQIQINMTSKFLARIFFDYMAYAMNPENTLQNTQQIDVNQFIDSLVQEPSD